MMAEMERHSPLRHQHQHQHRTMSLLHQSSKQAFDRRKGLSKQESGQLMQYFLLSKPEFVMEQLPKLAYDLQYQHQSQLQ